MAFSLLTFMTCVQSVPPLRGSYIPKALTPARPFGAGGCHKSPSGCLGSGDGWPLAWCMAAAFLPAGLRGPCLVKWPPLLALVPGAPICCLGVNMIHGAARQLLSDGSHCGEDGNQIILGWLLASPAHRHSPPWCFKGLLMFVDLHYSVFWRNFEWKKLSYTRTNYSHKEIR